MAEDWGPGNKAKSQKNRLTSAKSLGNLSSLYLCWRNKDGIACLVPMSQDWLEVVWKEKISRKTPKCCLCGRLSSHGCCFQDLPPVPPIVSDTCPERNSVWVGEWSLPCCLKDLQVHSPWKSSCVEHCQSYIHSTEGSVKWNFPCKVLGIVFWSDGNMLPTLSLPHLIFLLNDPICRYNTGEKCLVLPRAAPTLLMLDSWDFCL